MGAFTWDATTEATRVPSGVSLGSSSCHLLFLVMINDFLDEFQLFCQMCVDDTKMVGARLGILRQRSWITTRLLDGPINVFFVFQCGEKPTLEPNSIILFTDEILFVCLYVRQLTSKPSCYHQWITQVRSQSKCDRFKRTKKLCKAYYRLMSVYIYCMRTSIPGILCASMIPNDGFRKCKRHQTYPLMASSVHHTLRNSEYLNFPTPQAPWWFM